MPRHLLIYLLSLILAGCAAQPAARPATTAPTTIGWQNEVIEYRMVNNAKATDVASVLRQLLPITVDADPITDTVIMSGKAVYVAQAADIISKLDSIPWDLTPDVRFVHRMKYAKARDVVVLLRDMAAQGFFPEGRPDPVSRALPPIFDADDGQNMLIVRVPHGCDVRVRQVIEEVDKPQEAK